MQTIKAKITGVRLFENNWAVISFDQGGKSLRAVGTLIYEPSTLDGVVCMMDGDWGDHPKHGATFKLSSITPAGSEMFFFLTRVVKIGAKPAQFMLGIFSDDELSAIMEDPSRHHELLQVKGLGPARLVKVVESWKKYRPIKLLSDFLVPYGITPNLVIRIYTHFEDRAIGLIKDNPYQLTKVDGIGFKKADDIALKLGMKPHDPFRLAACVEFVMLNMADSGGNTLVKPADVCEAVIKELDCETGRVELSEVENELARLEAKGDIVRLGDKVSLVGYFAVEKRILELLKYRQTMAPTPIIKTEAEIDRFIAATQKEMGLVFSDEQAEAIRLIAKGHRTIAVCGLAGSGKSTLSRALIKLLMSKFSEENVCCMALSGIASDRIRKTSGYQACTLHTALGWKGTEFEFGPDKQLGYQVVLLDESSMVNSVLMRQIIGAVDRDSILILMGDPGQLPSIGAGDPFRNIIDSGLIPVARLTKIYRQSPDSMLTTFASEVRQGAVPAGYLRNAGYKDFQFVEKNMPQRYWSALEPDKTQIKEENNQEILTFIRQKMEALKPHIKDPILDFQLLSPMRKGPLGTDALNLLAQSVFNPGDYDGRILQMNEFTFKPGDKVVHTQNKDMQVCNGTTLEEYQTTQYSAEKKRVFNGSVGIVLDVDPENRQLVVAYPEGFIAKYDSLLLLAGVLEPAFCLTCHKVQGSEYLYVLMPITSAHFQMLTAQWLYTAITRAKQKVVLVGQKYMFEKCCKSLANTQRTTVLEYLFQQGKEALLAKAALFDPNRYAAPAPPGVEYPF